MYLWLRPNPPHLPVLRLLSLRRRPNTTATATAVAHSSPPSAASDPSVDHHARGISLLPDLVSRGLISAARGVINRVVSRSSLPDSVAALRHAAFLGLSLDYAVLLGSLVASGQLLKAEALFTGSAAIGIVAPHDSTMLSSMTICYCKLGKLGRARTQLGRLVKIESLPSSTAYEVSFHAFCKEGQYLDAHGLFLSMASSGLFPSRPSYNVLIHGLCSNGHLDKARHMFDVMLRSGIRPTMHLYKSLVYGFCKKNRTQEAERMLEEMESRRLFPDLRMYTTVMQRYCEEGRMESALNLLDRMGKHEGCCQPDASVYSRLVSGTMKQGDFDTAGKLFNQMIVRGFEPDRLLSFNIVNLHCRKKKVDCACIFLDIMVKCRLNPDSWCYIVVISALCRENKLEEADRWFDKMLDRCLIPDRDMLISLIKSLPRGQESRIIYKILLAMAKMGCAIDLSVFSKPFPKETPKREAEHITLQREAERMFDIIAGNNVVPVDVALNTLIHALCIDEKADLALFFMGKMVDLGCKALVFTYNSIIKCLCKARRLENPQVVIGLMQKWGMVPNMSTYLILVDACCKHGDINSAFGIFDQMVEKGPMPTIAIYDSIIGSLCRERRLQEAEYMFQTMVEAGVKPDEVVYATLINGYSKMGRAVDACNGFSEMLKEGLQPSLRSYRALINVLMKKNMFNKACQLLHEMLGKGVMPDTALYTMLISQFARKGKVGFAFTLYDLMVRDQIEPNLITVGSLISGTCRSILNRGRIHPLSAEKLSKATHKLLQLLPQRTVIGKLDKKLSFSSPEEMIREAFNILRYINKNLLVLDLHIYNGMVNFFCTTRKVDDALDIVDSMLEAGILPNHVTYTILIKGYIKSGEIGPAVEVFNIMNKQGCLPDEITYNSLIKGLCMAGRGIDALSLIYMMQKRGFCPDNISYDKLVEFFSNYSCDTAFMLFEEMLEHGYIPQHKNYNRLLWILIQEDKLREAYKIFDMMLKKGRSMDQETKKQLMEVFYRQRNST